MYDTEDIFRYLDMLSEKGGVQDVGDNESEVFAEGQGVYAIPDAKSTDVTRPVAHST